MSDDKDLFAQVDVNLDTHPKIRKAGSFGRQVFEFVLRRNAMRGFKGTVPVSFIDPDYLADLLMVSRDEAVTGVTKAVTANLIAIDSLTGVVRIVGWHESWGRRAKEGKERTKEWRDRKSGKRAEQHEPVTPCDDGDETPSQVTARDESDAKRREEKRDLNTHTRARERHPDAGAVARRVWDYAAKLGAELKLANVRTAVWPLMAGADHPGWQLLLDRVCELLVNSTAEQAEAIARNRVDVAKAKAIDDGDGQWFSPTAMFTASSFAHWSTLDPALVGKKRSGPRRAGEFIGPADPRKDHPDGERLLNFSELGPP